MFGRKKEAKKERPARPAGSLAQYGIFEIPENLGDLGGSIDIDDDDDDLEAELAALTTGDEPIKPRRKAPVPPKPAVNLDDLINESMRDINSDDEISGNDDDDDPDLLNELKNLNGESEDESVVEPEQKNDAVNDVSEISKLLEERLSIYKLAEQKAKLENESSKARRYNRGVKTLEHLLSSCKHGEQIDQSEIPPVLPPSATRKVDVPSAAPEVPAAPESVQEPAEISLTPAVQPEPINQETTTPTIDEATLKLLKIRQEEYKKAALVWKKSGNREEALKHMQILKQFDAAFEAISQGNIIDLSDMPPSPSLPNCTVASESALEENKEENTNQTASLVEPNVPASSASEVPVSLETALKERLEIYRRSKTVAESEGNSSKARRYGRICKQFEDALKLHARGKPLPIDELPTPPGFPPLTELAGPKPSLPKPTAEEVSEQPETPKRLPPPPPAESPGEAAALSPSPEEPATPVAPLRKNSDKNKKLTTRVDKQIEALKNRQRELRLAAKTALIAGDKDSARDYLRQAKGIDPLINVSLSGLPVDMNSIPLSPQAKLDLKKSDLEPEKLSDDSFTVITSMDCSEEATGTDPQIYENLEDQLKKQIKWCLTTRDHCKALGDVPSYNKWERLALNYTKDLDMLRVRKRANLSPPQHHYEVKTYSIVQSCTDMTDADVEISIIRGINYTKEVDTYVMFELPLPPDSTSSDRTSTVRDTCNPEYNTTFPLNGIIDRKSRQCLRVFKRHALKCQVWSKGGFFRADSLVGTVTIKLQPLETKCILHDSFPLMEGRKAVGGSLEVKIRLRNPILTKQIEQNTDKWLAIDH
ncbi:coiled-coil and C2 domain-containing protein 1-like isoform X2 [Copidosoma floridanum]|uniref:coiled-coil and C2 domain-containing protein 1-like isoform X2 n=1 Tax=Copidosoma floridanum TaxID=29053 RepID=UPI0006C9DE82|nr:coiled-coil and C2 domain-containing protein 1-like isoform X2 [Copidosoma floridanum]